MLIDFSQYTFEVTVPKILPLLSAILVFILAVLVFFQNRKAKVNLFFSLFSFGIALWLVGTFMLFISNTVEQQVFWDRFIYLGVVTLPIMLYQFGAAFARVQPPRWRIWIGYALTIFFLFISRTDYFVSGVFQYQWGVHTQAKLFHHLFLLYFYIYITKGISYLRQYSNQVADPEEKLKANYAFYAFLFLFVLGSLGYLPAYNIAIYPFGYIAGVIFVLILTYTITKHHLFNLKAVASEIFVFAISSFFLIQVFTSETVQIKVVNGGLFLTAIILGSFLIQSVLNEINQREKLQQLSNELADLNTNLQQKVAEQTQEVRKAYEVEKKARIELEELDKAKDQFILTTQHHLRTPLTIIKGFLDTTLTKKAKHLDEETYDYLGKASSAAERMAKLINDFLGVSQLEVGKAIFKFQPTNIKVLIEEIYEEISPEIEKKGLSFHIDFSAEAREVLVNIDREAMKAALYNLIDNSVKYTSQGGIAITGTIRIHPIERNKILEVIIHDTGIGISQEELPKIFNRYFQRGEEAEKMYTTGRGIGLVLSKNIIQANHGQIKVESEGRGKGSSFIVQLLLA